MAADRSPAANSRPGTRRAGAVLLYHRIGTSASDVHGLEVSPGDFRAQMEHLRAHYHPMSLSDLATAVRQGTVPERAVAITFDDGYHSDLAVASPVLTDLGIPATFFLTTDRLESPYSYWWDVLEDILLSRQHDLPSELHVQLPGGPIVLGTRTASEQQTAYWEIYRAMASASADRRDRVIDDLRSWAGGASASPGATRRMDAAEVLELAGRPGHEIGAHTVRHLMLPEHPLPVKRSEIEECKERLERLLGRPISSFAYPFGALDGATVGAVRDAGFELAVTCERIPFAESTDPLLVPRHEVTAQEDLSFEAWMSRILTSAGADLRIPAGEFRRRALVVGWFSYAKSDYTAGDLLACDLVLEWLQTAGYDCDIAHAPDLPGGVDLDQVDPAAYSHAIFVCGPFMQHHWEAEFLGRFAHCAVVGVNLSLPVPVETWQPFDHLLERDSSVAAHPDITFLSTHGRVPVVGVCLVEPYPPADVGTANAAIERLLSSNELAIVPIDTRLDENVTGLRTKAEIESLLARMDVVVTTRLHGTVLALKNGVPVVAIDPEPGGAKIVRQAETIGWPVAFPVDVVDQNELQAALEYCLTEEARARARDCRDRAIAEVARMRVEFITVMENLEPGGPKSVERFAFANRHGWPPRKSAAPDPVSGGRTGPLVSVITIFLDCRDYLPEAIDSVLSQEYDNWELILVDDGSTDGSSAIARGYAERYPDRIRYLAHPGHENRGMSASRNVGIASARGRYIALLDGDDVWLPGKLRTQVDFLESRPAVGMVYGLTEYWHSWKEQVEGSELDHVPTLGLGNRTIFDPPELLARNYPLGDATAPCLCSLLARTDAVRRVGGFEEDFRGFYEDQAFLAKMYLHERIGVLEECHDRYRIHDQSCSAVTRRAGEYDNRRAAFLRWLTEYLASRRIALPEIEEKLNVALGKTAPRIEAGSAVQWLRLLRVAEGGSARLSLGNDPNWIRIEIAHAGSPTAYDIQLNLPRLKVIAGREYVLTFMGRADSPRVMHVGCADGRAPWQNLGLYEPIQLTTEWQFFSRGFAVTRDQEDARVHFDAGETATSLELAVITLYDVTAAAVVRPDIPGNRVARTVAAPPVQVGMIDFGALRRVTPISPDFGCDRGQPVDRYYITQFLASRANDVRGRVLEIGESTYTRAYGGDRVVSIDVLHVTEGDPEATIIADLSSADHISSNSFDCLIITQTLQLIFDVEAAIRTMHRILKRGGVALVTLPGISQTYDSEWGSTWFWNFTELSARRLFEEVFGAGNVEVEASGNTLAAISFLHGIAAEELTPEELDHREPGYDVSIAVRAIRRGTESLQS